MSTPTPEQLRDHAAATRTDADHAQVDRLRAGDRTGTRPLDDVLDALTPDTLRATIGRALDDFLAEVDPEDVDTGDLAEHIAGALEREAHRA